MPRPSHSSPSKITTPFTSPVHHSTQTSITSHISIRTSHEHYHDTYGDLPSTPKPTHHFRILFSNVNGISTTNTEQESHQIGHTADAYQVDYLGLAETNVQWNHMTIRDTIKHTLQKYWKQTIITTTSTPTTRPGKYQPGGTLTLIGNKWTGGVTPRNDISGMGRWTGIQIQGQQNITIHLITAYRVPKINIAHAGPNTSYYHQWHHLRRQGTPVPDPRQYLLDDLGRFLTTMVNESSAAIISMDANEVYTDRNSPLHKWMLQHSLVDIHMALYELDTMIST